MVALNSEKEIPVGRWYRATNALFNRFITGLNPSLQKRSTGKSWWEVSLHSCAKPNSQGTGDSTMSNERQWAELWFPATTSRICGRASFRNSHYLQTSLPIPALQRVPCHPDKTVGLPAHWIIKSIRSGIIFDVDLSDPVYIEFLSSCTSTTNGIGNWWGSKKELPG